MSTSGWPVQVRVDWDDAGDWSHALADVSAQKHLQYGVRVERGRDQGRIIGGPKVSTASFSLTNTSKRYATEFTGSPLHGMLQSGHLVDIARILGVDASWDDPAIDWDDPEVFWGGQYGFKIFTGRTSKSVEQYGIGRRNVKITSYGLMNLLVNTKISINYQAAITTGAAMELVLDTVEFLTGRTIDRVIDADEIANGFELLHWYVYQKTAWQVVRQIWATAGPPAAVYEDPEGRFVFEGKTYRVSTTRCTSVQAIFTDLNNAEDRYHTDIQYDSGEDSIINKLSIEIETREARALQKVHDYGGVLTLGASEVRDVIVKNTSSNTWTNVQTPTVTTDFLVTAGSLSSVTVLGLGPLVHRVRFTAGAGGATIGPIAGNEGFQVRAQPVEVISSDERDGTIDTSASIAAHGVQEGKTELAGAIWPSLSTSDADALIDGYLLAYSEPRRLVTIRVTSADLDHMLEIVGREISDRILVYDASSGIALDVSIEQIVHDIETATLHHVTFVCEKIVDVEWARWDSGLYDVGRYGQ
jgi:hypothetical protein